MKWFPLLVLVFVVKLDAQEHCHKLEGKNLPHCTPQAKPLECGPPKPCPPCNAFRSCSEMIVTERRGGTCAQYGTPVCHQEGDRTVCGDAPCVRWTDATCTEIKTKCGVEQTSYPSTGTYDCTYTECNCQQPPPGFVNCGTSVICQGNQSC